MVSRNDNFFLSFSLSSSSSSSSFERSPLSGWQILRAYSRNARREIP